MEVKAYVLSAAVASLTLSFAAKDARPAEGITPGDLAPRIESLGSEQEFSFHNHSGRYTLLSFWAAYDAESRVRNVLLWNEVKRLGSERVAMYSVSFDEKESVFAETVKADGLCDTKQIYEGLGEQSELYQKFRLDKGLGSYLIDASGVIVARDVTPDKLVEILKSV